MDVSNHHNAEGVIRCYMRALPPRGVKSILDIGAGTTAPYKGILSNRCEIYKSLDIRAGEKVDIVCDLTTDNELPNDRFEWGWTSEVVEHIPQNLQEKFVTNILKIVDHVIFTYPTPKHETFYGDPGHVEVIIDFEKIAKKHKKFFYDFSFKSGRNVHVISDFASCYATNKGLWVRKIII